VTGILEAIFGRAAPPPEARTPGRSAWQQGRRPRQMRTTIERLSDPEPGVRAQALGEQRTEARAAGLNLGPLQGLAALPMPREQTPEVIAAARAQNTMTWDGAARDAARPAYWNPGGAAAQPARAATTHPVGPGGVAESETSMEMASRVTGAPAVYLRAIAGQEGMNDERAKNPGSSATGLGQFIDGTWLRMMREHGGQYGLPSGLSNAQILALRTNGRWSMLMTGHLYEEEAGTMTRLAHRTLGVHEVYLGHFLGGGVAGRWIENIERARDNRRDESARSAIRRLNPSEAEGIIRSNRRQFAPGVTMQDLYNMQTGDFVTHGIESGATRAEMTARVRVGRSGGLHADRGDNKPRNGGKQTAQRGTIIGSRALAQAERDRANDERGAESSAPRVNLETGEAILPTEEELREEQRINDDIERRRARDARTRFELRSGRIGVRVPFKRGKL